MWGKWATDVWQWSRLKLARKNAQDWPGLVQLCSSLCTEQLFCLIHKHWRMHSHFRQLSVQIHFCTDWIVPETCLKTFFSNLSKRTQKYWNISRNISLVSLHTRRRRRRALCRYSIISPMTSYNCTQRAIWRRVDTVAANDVTASSRAG